MVDEIAIISTRCLCYLRFMWLWPTPQAMTVSTATSVTQPLLATTVEPSERSENLKPDRLILNPRPYTLNPFPPNPKEPL